VTTPEYVPEGDKLRCLRHDVVFTATGSCAGCVQDPGTAPADEEFVPPSPPKGLMSTESIERELIVEALEIRQLRRKLVGGKVAARRGTKSKGKKKSAAAVLDLHAYNTIAKLADVYAKLMRTAHECASRREDEAVQRERERRKREMEGAGGP
jgi:hypothetical protein